MKNKVLKIVFKVLLWGFAIFGFGLTATFIGMKLHIFNDRGSVDVNDRYFQEMHDNYKRSAVDTSINEVARVTKFYAKLFALNKVSPLNAALIHKAYLQHKNIILAERMLEPINIYLKENIEYQKMLTEANSVYNDHQAVETTKKNIYEWMNIGEWQDFKYAVVKDTLLIDSAAKLTGVEPRLIVAVLVGEQMRLFNSSRETYKKVIGPLKILSVESNFSLGVTGVKPETAVLTEKYLKDSTSIYYPGKKYAHLLDFYTSDISGEREARLINYRNHFYSYLYAAAILLEMRTQWKKSGFDISDRPEILATLFNLGYVYSKPKINPSVGGANISINGKIYTFGALANEFYYSGEMVEQFPYAPEPFKD